MLHLYEHTFISMDSREHIQLTTLQVSDKLWTYSTKSSKWLHCFIFPLLETRILLNGRPNKCYTHTQNKWSFHMLLASYELLNLYTYLCTGWGQTETRIALWHWSSDSYQRVGWTPSSQPAPSQLPCKSDLTTVPARQTIVMAVSYTEQPCTAKISVALFG